MVSNSYLSLIFSLVETYALSQLSKKTYGEVAVGSKYKRF